MPPTDSNPLSSSSLLTIMSSSLTPPTSDLDSNEPVSHLKNPSDAIALAVHACMISVGFRLIGLDEDSILENPISPDSPSPLPPDWTAKSPSHTFLYTHSQSALRFILSLSRLGPRAVIDALAPGHDKRTGFDILLEDYISPSSLPLTLRSSDPAERTSALQATFISPARLADLAQHVQARVIQVLVPGLHKDGYEETANPDPNRSTTTTTTTSTAPSAPAPHPRPLHDPTAPPFPYGPAAHPDPLRHPRAPGHPDIPGFEDEYEILRVPGGRGPAGGMPWPPRIGEDDLHPPGLGPRDPLRPSFGPGGGAGAGGAGGMVPGWGDPMFGGGEGGELPDPRRPGGARYDPVGPGDPLGRRGGSGRGFGFGGGGGGGGFGFGGGGII